MLGGVRAASAGRPSAIRWLSATMLLGTGFAALHLREWFSMIHEGWSPSHNPLGGSPLFGAAFFGITGLHLLHVVSGVIAIGVVTLLYRRGRLDASYIETTGLYWHFVDLVWMFVFPLVYLLNAR
jgi:cytochrome c oxidase subunit 3